MSEPYVRNLTLPGSLRYQPPELKEFFGYDNNYRGLAEVELATLSVLAEIGIVPLEVYMKLSGTQKEQLLNISTTEVDALEKGRDGKKGTGHDVRAWVKRAQEIVGMDIGRWLHIPLTSYDPLDTGRIIQFIKAYDHAIRPAAIKVLESVNRLIHKFVPDLMIGRTHGQHALPITVGFWLATIQYRLLYNLKQLDCSAGQLVGKISGAVGAYNAQVCLGVEELCGQTTFEQRVLDKLGVKLQPAPISTQILPPEPLAYFLFSACMMSASLGQFGRDCRNLMRSEIAEISESFEEGQVGSSTMAHKRNPINFEQLEGMWIRTKNEFGKVMDTMISEHQRDLVGSSVARDFPIILVNLQTQLNTLLRKNNQGIPFLERLTVNNEACRANFDRSAHLILAEPLYIALIMAGYPGDAHHLVNHTLTPIATKTKRPLIHVLQDLAENDETVQKALNNMPPEIKELLVWPESYVGKSRYKAMQIAELVKYYISLVQ
jgi:adenylosuccinate lyase